MYRRLAFLYSPPPTPSSFILRKVTIDLTRSPLCLQLCSYPHPSVKILPYPSQHTSSLGPPT
ncbi:hypothetical protein BDY19DRAFT_972961 [Irpex rosettiformis]|uniref:Uncharacterized protein n=1 Tax=Irpex rosettiformis TaxID=378272 RepID=A0ACB8TQJ8_9APHY|nr:hypothetical protein BDY19DRAFT_972961 [Irpex rosettiformis]